MRRYGLFPGLLALAVLGLLPLLASSAAPLRQTQSLTLVSNQGQATDQIPDRTLLQAAPLPLPDAQWDNAYFDDSGWANAFPVIRRAPWNSNGTVDPIVNGGADHVWGGAPSGPLTADAGGSTDHPPRGGAFGFPISAQTPQTLFLRKTFCVALDAAVGTISSPAPGLELMLATDFGPIAGAALLNEWPVNTTLPGDGVVYTYGLGAAPFQRGQNALALWAQDNRGDEAAAVLYRFTVNYDLDPNALTVAGPAGAHAGQPVTFNASHDGLSGRPLTFSWDMGDSTVINTGATPSVNYAYPATGTFVGLLTVTDDGLLGCSATEPFTITVDTAALNVIKTDRFDPVAAGDFIDYDLTVQNTGAVATFGDTTVTDQVPANTTYVSCFGGVTCGEAGGIVSWNVGPLAASASAAISFRVQVDNAPPPSPPLITNATYGASSGGGVVFNGTTPVTTTIIVLGTATPTPTPTAMPTNTPTATPAPPATATATPAPPPPTSGPVATSAPTATATSGAPTPAFLPVSGEAGSGSGVWTWGGLSLLLFLILWTWQQRRSVT